MRIVLLLFVLAFGSNSALGASAPCDDLAAPDDARFLPSMRERALAVARVYCAEGSTQADVTAAFKDFIRNNVDWFDPFGGFASDAKPMLAILGAMDAYGDDDLPAVGLNFADELTIGTQQFAPRDPATCSEEAGGDDCAVVLDEFVAQYTYAQAAYALRERKKFVAGVLETGSEWDRYLSASRSFTPLELAVNSWLFRRNESVNFESPPDLQWVVLHPTLAVENVDDTSDGDQAQAALVVDVLGVNWWRQDRWYMPSGFAASFVYSDRPGVRDWGYGASVYFDSIYTLGYSNHDGEHGVYLTANLLKVFQNKQKDFRKLIGSD